MIPSYAIMGCWGPRRETPEALAPKALSLFDALAEIHPAYSRWTADFRQTKRKGLRLPSSDVANMAELIAEAQPIDDEGEPETDYGYRFTAANSDKAGPLFLWLMANVGVASPSQVTNSV
jgi:hypothetical protein